MKQDKIRIPGETAKGGTRQGFHEAAQDPELERVLKDFRASVHAWSEGAYRSRTVVFTSAPPRILWRRSMVWALSLVLMATVVMTGIHQYHQKDLARPTTAQQQPERPVRQINHDRNAAVPGQAVQQHDREADELLAKVDSDVARETPSAMEPLASLMADDETQ